MKQLTWAKDSWAALIKSAVYVQAHNVYIYLFHAVIQTFTTNSAVCVCECVRNCVYMCVYIHIRCELDEKVSFL